MNQLELLRMMIQSACADGNISEKELLHLRKKANEANISSEDLEFLIQTELKRVISSPRLTGDSSGFINSEDKSGFIEEKNELQTSDIQIEPKKDNMFSDIVTLNTNGAMSLIQKAKYLGTKWVIIKKIKPEFKDNKKYIELFEKEFDSLFQLDHQSIVRVYGKGKDADGNFYYMEYIDGRTISEMINNKEFHDEKFFKNIVNQILDALIYVHKKQIYHRDLKPDNILVTFKGDNVKILDFGLANADTFIDTLEKVGTPKYASPESSTKGYLADQRADIYSIGVIMLEMLTSKTAKSSISEVKDVTIRKIIQKCTEEKPQSRFDNCQEIKNLLASQNPKKTIPEWFEQKIIEFTTDGKITPNEKRVLDIEAQNNNIDLAAMHAVINLYLEKAKERLQKENEKQKQISKLQNNKVINNKNSKKISFYKIFRIFIVLILVASLIYIGFYYIPKLKDKLNDKKTEKYQDIKEKKVMYVNVSSLNLRKTATTDGEIIGSFPQGTEVVVTEMGYYWARVQVGGLDGYMSIEYLTDEKP